MIAFGFGVAGLVVGIVVGYYLRDLRDWWYDPEKDPF